MTALAIPLLASGLGIIGLLVLIVVVILVVRLII